MEAISPQTLSKTILKKTPSSETFPTKHNPIKRIFDLIFALLILLLTSPIFLIIALAIKLTSKGKIVYSHERIGKGGRPFPCYKFRTMYQDADERLETILKNDSAKRKEWIAKRKLKEDPRITRVGKVLRKLSLDELPQFFNVLRGDLSVVGPRPVVQEEISQYFGTKAKKILSIRPGLTGIWQVSGRTETSYKKRIEMDEKYVDNHTFWLDLKIILKTIPKMISAKGAY